MQRLCAAAVDQQLQRLEVKLQTVRPPPTPTPPPRLPRFPLPPPSAPPHTRAPGLTLAHALALGQVEELGGILQREREQLERARAQAARSYLAPPPITTHHHHHHHHAHPRRQVFSERLQLERRRLAPAGAAVPTHGVVATSVVPQAQPRTG